MGFAHFCMNSVNYTMMSWGPTYCTSVLQIPLQYVGLALAVPVGARTLGSMLGGIAMDKMLSSGPTVLSARRRVLILSFVAAGAALVPLGYATSIVVAGTMCILISAGIGAADCTIMANYV